MLFERLPTVETTCTSPSSELEHRSTDAGLDLRSTTCRTGGGEEGGRLILTGRAFPSSRSSSWTRRLLRQKGDEMGEEGGLVSSGLCLLMSSP